MAIGNYRRPKWLQIKPFDFTQMAAMDNYVGNLDLNTVCSSARCPNRATCFARHQVTFLILGNTCTRRCAFCAVNHGAPQALDPLEAAHIALAVRELRLKHAVITSVTRDDLNDGGASQYARTVVETRKMNTDTTIEILIPDFNGSFEALGVAMGAGPNIVAHNLDTVPRLYPRIRPQADYRRSLDILKGIKEINRQITTKSGLMLGLGESQQDVLDVMEDLRKVDCDILTIGQYLAPSLTHYEPHRYAPLDEFEQYRKLGNAMGFTSVYSAPLVRSSFCTSEE
jgi:lipoyl synthase